jgi:hypothetical protein
VKPTESTPDPPPSKAWCIHATDGVWKTHEYGVHTGVHGGVHAERFGNGAVSKTPGFGREDRMGEVRRSVYKIKG